MYKSIAFCCLLLLSAPAFAQSGGSARKPDGLPFRHSMSVTPFSGMVTYSEFNPGVGITYEYIFNQEAGIGVNIPLMFGYSGPEQSGYGYNYYKHTVAYAAPGLRFHTGRRRSRVDFATGPSLILGNMRYTAADFYPNQPPQPAYNYSMFGIAADNSLNFYRGHFAFGLDLRIGTMFESHDDSRFFIHFGMHFGGIF